MLGVLLEGLRGNRHRLPSHPTVTQPVLNRHQIDLRPLFGTAPLPTGISGASSRGEGYFWTVFGTATLPTGTSGDPHVPNNPAISLKPASNRTSTGLRHGDLTHRYSRAIPAWRRGSSDRSLARRPRLQVPQGHPRVAKSVFLPVFDTATLPTSTSSGIPTWRRGLLSPLVHEMSLSHGCRAPDRVFVHEMSLSHGCRGPDRVFVHEMSLSHGRRGPGSGTRPDNGIFRIAK